MRYQHIIWDWNGTLINDTWLCLDIINELLNIYHKPLLTLELYHEVFDFPVRNYYQRIGFDFEQTPFEQVGTEFMQRYWQRWTECQLHTGARELCSALHERGIPQVIISAAETRLLDAGVKHFNITSQIEKVWGLDHHYATSKEGLAREFVENVSVAPEQILFIGDTMHDHDVARAAGVYVVLFSGGHHPRRKLLQCGVPVFDSLSDIHQFILTETAQA